MKKGYEKWPVFGILYEVFIKYASFKLCGIPIDCSFGVCSKR